METEMIARASQPASVPRPGPVAASAARKVAIIDPLADPRWDEFLARHPEASLFHTSSWLRTLAETYGYEPVAYTTSRADEPLANAAVFCRVDSWLTGKRLVSLPFSDHCEWLVDGEEDTRAICGELQRDLAARRWRYLEVRALRQGGIPVAMPHFEVTYTFHELDLAPRLETIFGNFHHSSIQRKIRRAERDGLVYGEGRSGALLDQFYHLFRMTRKRHRLPPQPRAWFANILKHPGNGAKIRVAYKDGRAVAAMITARYKGAMMYKYGGSDAAFNKHGSMHLLFWNAIQEAKRDGLRFFDFGRTDADQQGLITFKGRWGAKEHSLVYSRYSAGETSTHLFDLPGVKWKGRVAKLVLSRLPAGVIARIGEMLYGHVG